MTDTRTRILDTAEELFAERGIAQTSLRSLTQEAGVNLAAVHYHFGSREALIREVFARRIVPVNDERLRRLDEIEAGSAPDPPDLEAVIDAFVAPAFSLMDLPDGKGARFVKILARLFVDPTDTTTGLLKEFFPDVGRRFIAALGAALGRDADRDPFVDFKLVIGVMVHALTMEENLRMHLPHACAERPAPPPSTAMLKDRVVAFIAAGLRATAASPEPEERA